MSSLIRSPFPALINDRHIFVSGNVVIHPSAAIAPSVMLQADPGSQLLIGAGVCIGAGCILHAHQGTLEVGAGATLGSGVLIVGQGKIGANACIGAMTTIMDSSVLPGENLPPGSLIGDWSRQSVVIESGSVESDLTANQADEADPWFTEQGRSAAGQKSTERQSTANQPSTNQASQETAANASEPSPEETAGVKVVYGRASLERMMITMFPHRKGSEE
ncbi:transferase [Egbenema bharatensis]|uniref:transferase n=1 Tax=Egbenema bharatensis TaxID=3463334 RepID=UPI003A8AC89E